MSETSRNFNFYNQMAAKYLLRWNKNYFEWLEKYFGNPSEYGDGLKMAWSCGKRKVIYYPHFMMIQLHKQIDEIGVRWKLIETKSYPTKKNIEFYANWLKENDE